MCGRIYYNIIVHCAKFAQSILCGQIHCKVWNIVKNKMDGNLDYLDHLMDQLHQSVSSSTCILGFHVIYDHFPKLNITVLTQVLVSSDKRPYRNSMFHNVTAQQGSSYCNRACLNFSSFCVAWHENCDVRRLSPRSKDELSL